MYQNKELINITYKGENAQHLAHKLKNDIKRNSNISLLDPTELNTDQPNLGVAEIVITIMITSFAKSATEHIVNELEEYLLNLSQNKNNSNVNGKLIVSTDGKKENQKFPFRLYDKDKTPIKIIFGIIRELLNKIN